MIAPVSADGEMCFQSLADTHVIADVNGWIAKCLPDESLATLSSVGTWHYRVSD